MRNFNITAITTQQALANIGGALPLNYFRELGNSNGIMYVRSEDLVNGKLNCQKGADGRPICNAPLEPLVLRAAAGDCINVTLTNGILRTPPCSLRHTICSRRSTPRSITLARLRK